MAVRPRRRILWYIDCACLPGWGGLFHLHVHIRSEHFPTLPLSTGHLYALIHWYAYSSSSSHCLNPNRYTSSSWMFRVHLYALIHSDFSNALFRVHLYALFHSDRYGDE